MSTSEIEILDLVERLLTQLHKSCIPYCHWKSNIDLDKALRGEGDLDILIDRRHSSSFDQIVLRLGFKRGVVHWGRQFPGIGDYLGWDEESDSIVHLHVYYQLILGAPYVKSVHLPMERVFLSSRRKQGSIMTSSPECELLAFVLRSILRIRIYDIVICRKCPKRTVEELDFLTAEATLDILHGLLSSCQIPVVLFEEMKRALRNRSPWRMFWLKNKLERNLRPFQRFGWFTICARPVINKLGYRFRHIFNRGSLGEKPASGGMIVAVVGADGSGKSSLVDELHKWLSRNYAVQTYHLGKPKQSPSSYFMLRVAGLIRRFSAVTDSAQPGLLAATASILGQFCVARDRKRVYLKIRRSVGQGQIALTDRYPLRGVNMDSMSSIARYSESRNVVLRWLMQRTAEYYQVFTEPDLLLVLKVSLDVAARRRPDDSRDYLVSRIEAVNTITSGDNVLVLDAEKEHSQVIKEAKKTVWKWL